MTVVSRDLGSSADGTVRVNSYHDGEVHVGGEGEGKVELP